MSSTSIVLTLLILKRSDPHGTTQNRVGRVPVPVICTRQPNACPRFARSRSRAGTLLCQRPRHRALFARFRTHHKPVTMDEIYFDLTRSTRDRRGSRLPRHSSCEGGCRLQAFLFSRLRPSFWVAHSLPSSCFHLITENRKRSLELIRQTTAIAT